MPTVTRPAERTTDDRRSSPATSRSGGRPSTTSSPCSSQCPRRSGRPRPTWPAGTSGPSPRTPRTSRASWPAARRRPPTSASRRTSPASWGSTPRSAWSTAATASPDAIINEIREVGDRAAHRAARRPAHRRRRGKPEPIFGGVPVDLAHAAAQPAARHLDARAGRTPRGRPSRRHGHARRPGTPPSTSPRASASCSARRSARRPGTTPGPRHGGQRAVRVRGQRRTAAASGCREPPADPTVTLRMDRETLHPAGRRPLRRRAGRGHRRGRPASSASGSSPRSPPRRDMTAKRRRLELADIPDQAGRTILVTGTTLGGLGHHTALELARRAPAWCSPAARQARLDETARAIRAEVPAAALEQLVVDLSDLASVRRAADAAAAAYGPIDVLVNNAGVMGTPHQRTADGLELQLATNHFGPFLLTGLLLPQLVASEAATRRDGLVEHATASREAPRSATRRVQPRPLREVARLRRSPSWPTCCSPTSSTAAPARPELPVQGAGRAPRLRRHPPRRQRPVRPLRRRHRLDPRRRHQGGLAVRRRRAPGRR